MAALHLPIARHYATRVRGNDFTVHADFARQLFETGRPPVPHFLYHALLAGLHAATGAPFFALGVAVVVASEALSTWIVFDWLWPAGGGSPGSPDLAQPESPSRTRSGSAVLAAALAVAVLLFAPVTVLTWADRRLYWGYVVPNVFHNPTVALLKPLALLLFRNVVRLLDVPESHTPRRLAATAGLVVLGALAKPSHLIALLPAVMLLAALRRLRWAEWRALGFALFLPAGLLLAAQFAFAFGGGEGVSFSPPGFAGRLVAPGKLAAGFLASIVFPATAALVAMRRLALPRSSALGLAWLAFAFGAAFAYLLEESGLRSIGGNFLWSAQVTLFVLVAATVRSVLQLWTVSVATVRAVLAATLTAHVACGGLWAWAHLTRRYWW